MKILIRTARWMTSLWVLLAVVGCATHNSPEAPLKLKVMTYNIRIGAGGGAWPSDPSVMNLKPVMKLVAEQAPDLVGLQEVDQFRKRSAMVDQPAKLAEGLGMNVAFAEAYTVKTGAPHDEKYGVGLLTKHKILSQERFPLFKLDYSKTHPNYPDYFSEQRVLLHAPVQIHGQTVHVFVTHLGLTADQRQEQLKQIAEITAQYAGPKILMGDFNAQPSEAGLKLLGDRLQDVLTVTQKSAEERKSFPAGPNPRNAIDYIFASPEFRVLSARVIRDESLASDHNPVLAELELLPSK